MGCCATSGPENGGSRTSMSQQPCGTKMPVEPGIGMMIALDTNILARFYIDTPAFYALMRFAACPLSTLLSHPWKIGRLHRQAFLGWPAGAHRILRANVMRQSRNMRTASSERE